MRKEMQAKLAAAMEAQVSKLLNKLTTKKAELSKHEANAVPPKDFFSQPQFAGKYSALDAEGKPTADAAGAELNKNQKKDADKLWAKQDKEHTKYKEALAKTPSLLEDLRGAIGGLREEVSGLLRQHGANLGDELQQKLTGALS